MYAVFNAVVALRVGQPGTGLPSLVFKPPNLVFCPPSLMFDPPSFLAHQAS